MTTSISDNGINFADATNLSSAAQIGMRNKIINGNFTVNQRGYTSGTALAAGVYAHDRFKAGASGCTYTFTQAKPDTLVTITAGTLIQVIEDVNCTEAGYVISWTGTAQGRMDTGTYAASPIVVTGKTPGTQMQVEFGTGTLGKVQVEAGTVPTPFERRPIGAELLLCQRYLPALISGSTSDFLPGAGFVSAATIATFIITFQVQVRVPPTGVAFSSSAHFTINTVIGGGVVGTIALAGSVGGINSVRISGTNSGMTPGQACQFYFNTAGAFLLFSGCEL